MADDMSGLGQGIGVGAQVASAIVQYYNSERAHNASAQRLRDIEYMWNQIKPPKLDVSLFDDPKMIAGIPDAQFDLSKLSPELYQKVGQYIPEMADFVAEKKPQLVTQTAAARQGRDAQMEALQRYRDIGSGSFDPQLQEQLNQARDQTGRDAQSRVASSRLSAERRGVFGSGADAALESQSTADSFNREGDLSMKAAAEGYRNRLAAMASGAKLGGDIHASEMDDEARNADIANNYNQRFSKRYQDWLTQRADANNAAQLKNLDSAQRISDTNVALKNKYQQDDMARRNSLAQQVFENNRQKRVDRLDLDERKRKAEQADYENQVGMGKIKAGVQQDYRADTIARARDYNQQTRSVGDMISSAAGQMKDSPAQKDPTPEDNFDPYGGEEVDSSTPGNYRRIPSEYGSTA